MTEEVDLDVFFTGEIVSIEEPVSLEDAIEAERKQQELWLDAQHPNRITPDDYPPEPVPNRAFLRALFYVSHKAGEGHVVVLHETLDGMAVMCNCPAIRSLSHRPKGCWAMVDARAILGLPPIE